VSPDGLHAPSQQVTVTLTSAVADVIGQPGPVTIGSLSDCRLLGLSKASGSFIDRRRRRPNR
jgi:hypothetical protein